tara:strand:+ start:8153 stop:10462 length:2310 start_codon:yes stop_codon:yes gene_type:complete
MAKIDKKVSKVHQLFQNSNSAQRQQWETSAQTAYDFYLDNQLSEDEHNALVDQGMPTFTVNRIIPIVEMLVYYATAKSPRWQAVAVDGSDADVAAVFQDLSAYIWDISQGDALFANAITDSITKGMGWLTVTVDPNLDRGLGEVVVKNPDPFDIYVDQKSRDPLFRDATHIMVRKVLPKSQLIKLYPRKKQLIKNASAWDATQHNYSDRSMNNPQSYQKGDITEGYDVDGEMEENVEFIEMYEKFQEEFVNVTYQVKLSQQEIQQVHGKVKEEIDMVRAEMDVQMLEFGKQLEEAVKTGEMLQERAELELKKKIKENEQILAQTEQQLTAQAMEQVSQTDTLILTKKEFDTLVKSDVDFKKTIVNAVPFYETRVRQTCIAGDKLLLEYVHPITEYPLIPFSYKWTGTPFPMGAVSPLVGKQREMNKAHQLLIHNASLGSSLRWLYYDGSIDIDQWEKNAAAPGALLPIHSGFEKPTQIAPAPLSNAFYNVVDRGKVDLEYLAGIYSAMQGDSSEAPDTYKGLLALDEYGTRRIKGWMAIAVEPALKQLGEVVKQISQAVYTAPKVFRIVNPDGKAAEQQMNIPIYNDLGEEIQKFNDYGTAKFDVRILGGSTLPVNRWAYLDELKELMKLGVVDDIAVLGETDVRNKDQIAKRKSMYAQMQSQIGSQEEQIKDLNGTVETLSRQLVQAGIKNKVQVAEVQMTKQNLKGQASQELHRQRLGDSQKRHEERLRDTQKNFDARLKNIEKEVELNEKLKSANKKDVAENKNKE